MMLVVALMLLSFHECYGHDLSIQTQPMPSGSLDRQVFLSDRNVFPWADNYIRFYLNATGNAYLYLESADKSATERKIFYKITVSSSTFQNSIRLFNKPTDNEGFLVAETYENQLDVLNVHHFWVSWCGGTIKVGKRETYGDAIIMSWTNPFPFAIVDIGISGDSSYNWWFYSRNHDNSKEIVCSLEPCHYFSRSPECLKYTNLTSMIAPKPDCSWACSDNKDCFAWTHEDVNSTGYCNLLSGIVEQTFERTTCFIKHEKK